MGLQGIFGLRIMLAFRHICSFVLLGALLANLACSDAHAQRRNRDRPRGPTKRQYNHITQKNSPLLEKLFAKNAHRIDKWLSNHKNLRIQIIYTQIKRNRRNHAYVKHHTWGLDSLMYTFPASFVKLPVIALALERIHALIATYPRLNAFTCFRSGVVPGIPCQVPTEWHEKSKRDGCVTLAHCIKDILVGSGNISFDRLYEFLGQEYINRRLREKGYTRSAIVARYGHPCSPENDKHTNPMTFYDTEGVIYRKPAQHNPHNEYFTDLHSTRLGEGTFNGQYYRGKAFSKQNYMSLKDQHEILMALMIPGLVSPQQRFNLTKADYRMIHKWMSMYPTESKDPVYPSLFTTTLMKYFIYGHGMRGPYPNMRIFNKVGLASGFASDCAYIVDFASGIEFFLSASVFASPDGKFYGKESPYDEYAFPFLDELSAIILQYERERLSHKAAKYIRAGKDLPMPNLDFYKHDYSTY